MQKTWTSGRCFICSVITIMAAAATIALLTTSCEEGGVGSALGVNPSYATMAPNTPEIALTVVSGTDASALPLQWSVSNPDLGRVIGKGNFTAGYARKLPNGQNRVIVRDQRGVEGIVTIYQVANLPAQ